MRKSEYIQFLVTRRIRKFLIISLFLIILLFLTYFFIGRTQNQILLNFVTVTSTIIVNIIAAIFWYTMIQGSIYFERNKPISKVFPFTTNRDEKIHIILSSIPSVTGHKLTGMGEARALGMILETLRLLDFPMNMVETNFDEFYNPQEIKYILDNENVILLGGPNYNICTRIFFEENNNNLPFIFKEDSVSTPKIQTVYK